MTALSQILPHLPVWLFPLFVLLTYLGVDSMRDRQISIRRLTLLPAMMMLLSLSGLISRVGPLLLAALPLWLCFVLAGTWLGRRMAAAPLSVDRQKGRIGLAGSVQPLLVIYAIFILRTASGFLSALDPALAADPRLILGATGLGAVFSGILAGRSWRAIRHYGRTPAESLTQGAA